jgi:hypothetical protein
MGKHKDAWKQLSDLYDKYTKTWFVRNDLRVRALATQRAVEFALGEYKEHPKFQTHMWQFPHVTTRNVNTMRELALTLWAACDFVDASNPTWASFPEHDNLDPVESFESPDGHHPAKSSLGRAALRLKDSS